jgi:hypothetical protein
VNVERTFFDDRARPYPAYKVVLGNKLAGGLNQSFDDLECAVSYRDRYPPTCRQELADGSLLRILGDWSRGDRKFHALFMNHRTVSPKIRAFVNFIAAHFSVDS